MIGTAELKSILKSVASRDNGNLASQKLRINLRKCFAFGRLGRLGHVGTREGGANRLIRGEASHGLGYASSHITWTLPNIRSWKSGDFRGLCHSGGNAFFVQFQRPTKMTNHLWDGSF